MQSLFRAFQKTPILTLNFPAPTGKVILRRSGKNQFELDTKPGQVFTLGTLHIHPVLPEKRRASNGAIAGAFAASLRGRNILRGAIKGDWLEKKRYGKPSPGRHQVQIELVASDSGESLAYDIALTQDDARRVEKFFTPWLDWRENIEIGSLEISDRAAFLAFNRLLLEEKKANPFIETVEVTDFLAYQEKLRRQETMVPHPDWSTVSTFFSFVEWEIADEISCRWELNKGNLAEIGGHIGDVTSPYLRQKGVASFLLRFAFLECKSAV